MEMEKEGTAPERINKVNVQMEDLCIGDDYDILESPTTKGSEACPSTDDEQKKPYPSEEENGVHVDIQVAGDSSNDMQCRSGNVVQGVCLPNLITEGTSMYFHQVSASSESASTQKDMIVPDSPYRPGKSAVSPTPEMLDDRKKDVVVPKPNCTYSTQNEIIVTDSGYRSSRSAFSSTPEAGYDKMQDAVDAKPGVIENRQGISSEKTSMQVGRKEWGAVVPPIKLNPYEEQLNASSDKGKDVRTIFQMTEDEIGKIEDLDYNGRFVNFFERFPGFEEEDLQAAHYCSFGGQNPALSFLEALKCRRPRLTMQGLVEDASEFGREDLADFFEREGISLSCHLNLLSDRALSKLALKLGGGIAAPPATATWRHLAFHYGFTSTDINKIQHSQVKKNKRSPTAELFLKLQCSDPKMTVTKLKSHLFDAGFKNIAIELDLLKQQKLMDTK